MHLNAAGRIVQSVWDEIPTFYAGIKIDEFIVMPDHVHGIIQIVGAAPVAAPTCLSLSDAVHRSKSLSTNRYGNGVISQGWPPYSGRLWHRNYWERIIRQDSEYQAICQYIGHNFIVCSLTDAKSV